MSNRRIICAALTLTGVLGAAAPLFAQERQPNQVAAESLNLAPGDCALFVWTGYPSRLHFVSLAEQGAAFAAQDGGARYAIRPNRAADKFGQFPSQDFMGGTGKPAQLRLADPAALYKSVVYKSGTITLPAPDGWLDIESAQAVSTCNETSAVETLTLDNQTGSYAVPAWLQTPAASVDIIPQDIIAPAPVPLPPIVVEPEVRIEPEIGVKPEIRLEPEILVEREVMSSAPIPGLVQAVYKREIAPPPSRVEAAAQTTPDKSPPAPKVKTPRSYTVQIGAYPNEPLAHERWADFKKEFKYLRRKTSSVQVAAVENVGVVYRLRITGFPNLKRATRFCNRLKKDDVDCFVPLER